jgi:hypothetical protein
MRESCNVVHVDHRALLASRGALRPPPGSSGSERIRPGAALHQTRGGAPQGMPSTVIER